MNPETALESVQQTLTILIPEIILLLAAIALMTASPFFRATCRTWGSLAAAARSLHYGQPTISHHLATLENHVGARLVRRGPKGAELTDIGALFLEHVEPILNQIEAAEREVKGRLKHGVSTLRVGTFATAGARILPTALRGVISGSGIPVELFEDEPYELLRRLREGRLNCALTYELSNAVSGHDDDLACRPWSSHPMLATFSSRRPSPTT